MKTQDIAEQVAIRTYRAEDAARVKQITAEAFEPVSLDAEMDRRWPKLAPMSWMDRKWASMQPQLCGASGRAWVAEADSNVVGYVTCEVMLDRGVGHIGNVAVDARWCGKGLGRHLLEQAISHFRELRLSLVKIETLSHNEVGRHLYPALGFELIATQNHYVMPLFI